MSEMYLYKPRLPLCDGTLLEALSQGRKMEDGVL
jgi:hypothetical protein